MIISRRLIAAARYAEDETDKRLDEFRQDNDSFAQGWQEVFDGGFTNADTRIGSFGYITEGNQDGSSLSAIVGREIYLEDDDYQFDAGSTWEFTAQQRQVYSVYGAGGVSISGYDAAGGGGTRDLLVFDSQQGTVAGPVTLSGTWTFDSTFNKSIRVRAFLNTGQQRFIRGVETFNIVLRRLS